MNVVQGDRVDPDRELFQVADLSRVWVLADVYERDLADVKVGLNATLKLAQLPRNGAQVRVRLRCKLTGRPRGNYRKFELSRIMLRELGNQGQIPGMVKASW